MGLFIALGTLYPVQDFIALVHSRSSLLLASKADRILEIADDVRASPAARAAPASSRCRQSAPRAAAGFSAGWRLRCNDPWRPEDEWGPITAAVVFAILLAGLIAYVAVVQL
jgi:hypothetical protein